MKNDHLIKLKSALKQHIWGGTKIRDSLHKDVGDAEFMAESWEISTHPDGLTGIDSGKFKGSTLTEYFDTIGWDKVGAYGKKYRQLPMMVKYIDAERDLSVQVHPDDAYAREHENDSGKNEIWFIIGAEKGSYIYLGFNRDVTRAEVERSLAEGTVMELMNKIPVKKGEVYFIPAGTIHAIGKGCFICEIEQSSNVTYRLYDYGRAGLDGHPRELHISRGLDVLSYSRCEVQKSGVGDVEKLGEFLTDLFVGEVQCGLFRYEAKGEFRITYSRPRICFALTYKGKGEIYCDGETSRTSVGDTWLLNGKNIRISGKCRVILISLWG